MPDIRIVTVPVGFLQANCYLVFDGAGNAAVIDPGDRASLILDQIAANRLRVHALLLTHAHFDHMLAAQEIHAATGAPVMLHRADVPTLADPKRNLTPATRTDRIPTADRLLDDGDTVTIGSFTLTALHTPGHTPGGCCYYGAGVLFSGDTLFPGSFGRLDLPGGDRRAMIASLRRLAALEGDFRVLPGHGGETLLSTERLWIDSGRYF